MSRRRFYRGWLKSAGVSDDFAEKRATEALARVKRLPFMVAVGHLIAIFAVEWIFLLLVVGKPGRASSLTSEQWQSLDEKSHHHRFYIVRLIYLLARLPLFEQVYAENSPPPAKIKHPLENRIRTTPSRSEYDFIIIGTGAGGAPTAWSLSKAGYRVAIIESGNLTHPQTVANALEKYYTQQGFVASARSGLVAALAGNTIGGTTPINSGTSLTPPKKNLAVLDQKLGSRFAEGELDSHLATVSRMMGVTTPSRELLGPSCLLISQGLRRLGFDDDIVLPRAAPDCEGAARCCFVCPNGAKRGTDTAYLPDALQHGCEIIGSAKASRIRETAENVRVQFCSPEGNFTITAKHLVISAGSLNTPGLLRRNRLGSCWRDAGKNLRIHPASKVFAHFPEAVNEGHGVPQGLGFRHPDLPEVVFEGIFTPKAAAVALLQAAGKRRQFWFDHYDHAASYGFMRLDNDAKGRVFKFGNFIFLDYALTQESLADLVRAAIFTAEVFFAAGADRVLLPFAGIKNEFTSAKELRSIDIKKIQRNNFMASGFHPQGTAPMGIVTDTDLGLIGTQRISVCDASVLPASPGVNPQLTIMALALRLGDHLLNKYRQ